MYIWTIVSYQLVKFSQTVAYINVYVVTDNVRFELLQSIELFLAFIEDQFVTKLCFIQLLYNISISAMQLHQFIACTVVNVGLLSVQY